MLLLGLLAVAPAAAKLKTYDPVDLANFLLGPEYAQWLVGPIVHLATEQERREFLALTDDGAAAAFIEGFWERRGPNLVFPPSGPRHTFEQRALEADRTFSEGTFLGRRTDRGTVYILFGSPESREFASSPTNIGPPIEIWNYPKASDEGLHGERPDRRYGFRLQDSVTRFFPLAGVKRLRRIPSPNGVRE
jgi:GWxTD domain-containing protein